MQRNNQSYRIKALISMRVKQGIKIKFRWNLWYTSLLVILGISIIYLLGTVIVRHLDGKRTEEIVEDVLRIAEPTEVEPLPADQMEEKTEEEVKRIHNLMTNTNRRGNSTDQHATTPDINLNTVGKNGIDYSKIPSIKVDFNALRNINNQTVAWLNVNGTEINYPVVQAGDNSFYLNRSFNRSRNVSGWVFMDFRNNIRTIDTNTIIYAHSMVNRTMFGSLRDTLTTNWFNNPLNHIIRITTPDFNSVWVVYSVYVTSPDLDYIQVRFFNDASYRNFLEGTISRSVHDFKDLPTVNDKILTLSTCSGRSDRLVVHAKLVHIR
jgi:sortase B